MYNSKLFPLNTFDIVFILKTSLYISTVRKSKYIPVNHKYSIKLYFIPSLYSILK